MWAFENLSNDGTVARIGEGGGTSVDAEIVEGCQDRISVPFRGLSVILR